MIAFTFSGTGGHIYPCIALAQELPFEKTYFIGSHNKKESQIIANYGFGFVAIPSSKKNPITLFKGFLEARNLLKQSRTKLLISAGGYSTFPVAMAAKSLNIPIFLLEQNTIPGRANRLLSKFAKKIFVSFEESKTFFNPKITVCFGNPIRKSFLEDTSFHQLKEVEKQVSRDPKILIFGGSQGALFLNKLVKENHRLLLDSPYVFYHITGSDFYAKNYPKNARIHTTQTKEGKIKIITLPYFEKMDYLYTHTKAIICRAGATTIAEILNYKIPAILIPYPYAKDDHQKANAQFLESLNIANVIDQKNCTLKIILENISTLLKNPPKFPKNPTSNAREKIAADIKRYL